MAAFNFEAFFIAFGLIFLAELGDKTQLMVISLSAKEKSPLKIGLATSMGISLVAVIGIFLGLSVSLLIPIFWIKIAGVLVFFAFGTLTLWQFYRERRKQENEENGEGSPKKSRIKIKNMFIFALLSVFLMEFGDKTQIMTITLTATYVSPMEVGLGAVLSLTLLCFIGAYIGGYISKKLPRKWLDLGTGVFFIVMGVIMLVEAFAVI